jgi:hypothetical protein
LQSDRGWGGGSYPWQIVDGLRAYSDTWAHGLAFTGGHTGGSSSGGWLEPAGLRQATIDFGRVHTFEKVMIWHHGDEHVPETASLEYWDGTSWNSISFERRFGAERLNDAGGSVSDEYTFSKVTGSKVGYSFDNRGNNILGTPNVHGWIYEFEVFGNIPPTAELSSDGLVIEGSTATVRFSNPFDPSEADTAAGFRYAFDFRNDGTFEVGGETYEQSNSDPWAAVWWNFLSDGPATLTIRGRILDKDDGFTDYTTTLTVVNGAPTITSLLNSGPIDEGSSVTVTVTATDPGIPDPDWGTIGLLGMEWSYDTLSYEFDFDDDGTYEVGPQEDPRATYVFTDSGRFRVNVRVSDDDGGVAESTTTVLVIPLPSPIPVPDTLPLLFPSSPNAGTPPPEVRTPQSTTDSPTPHPATDPQPSGAPQDPAPSGAADARGRPLPAERPGSEGPGGETILAESQGDPSLPGSPGAMPLSMLLAEMSDPSDARPGASSPAREIRAVTPKRQHERARRFASVQAMLVGLGPSLLEADDSVALVEAITRGQGVDGNAPQVRPLATQPEVTAKDAAAPVQEADPVTIPGDEHNRPPEPGDPPAEARGWPSIAGLAALICSGAALAWRWRRGRWYRDVISRGLPDIR